MDVIIEKAIYNEEEGLWVQIVKDAETGEIIGRNSRAEPFVEEGEVNGT